MAEIARRTWLRGTVICTVKASSHSIAQKGTRSAARRLSAQAGSAPVRDSVASPRSQPLHSAMAIPRKLHRPQLPRHGDSLAVHAADD